jgi:hypothetical protein
MRIGVGRSEACSKSRLHSFESVCRYGGRVRAVAQQRGRRIAGGSRSGRGQAEDSPRYTDAANDLESGRKNSANSRAFLLFPAVPLRRFLDRVGFGDFLVGLG